MIDDSMEQVEVISVPAVASPSSRTGFSGRTIGLALTVATGGSWGAAKWIGRRFRGRDGHQTFLGRVATFVIGHAIYSLLIGTIGLWTLFKGIAYLMAILLTFVGYQVKPPPDEQEKAKSFLAQAADTVDDRVEKMKDKMDEMRRKAADEIAEKHRAFEESNLAEKAERIKRNAEEHAAKVKRDADEEIARAKAKVEEKALAIEAKAKAEIKEHTPSPWGMMFGSSKGVANTIDIPCPQCNRLLAYPVAQAENYAVCNVCNRGLARKGIVKTLNFPAPIAGQEVKVACSECGWRGSIVGDGKSKIFQCQCRRYWYILDGIEHQEHHERSDKFFENWNKDHPVQSASGPR